MSVRWITWTIVAAVSARRVGFSVLGADRLMAERRRRTAVAQGRVAVASRPRLMILSAIAFEARDRPGAADEHRQQPRGATDDTRLTKLPIYLAAEPSRSLGLGVIQKTATALSAEVRLGANPASLDYVPVAGSIEDHATMAVEGVAKAARTIDAALSLLAIELIVSSVPGVDSA